MDTGYRPDHNANLWEVFVEAAGREFRFLETGLGFLLKSTTPPFLIYESEEFQVRIYYSIEKGHELDLGIRRLADDPSKIPSIGLGELMLLVDREAANSFRSSSPSGETSLKAEVRRLAQLLEKYGSSLLKGDKEAFERIEQLRREREKTLAAATKQPGKIP